MKKIILSVILASAFSSTTFAQTPSCKEPSKDDNLALLIFSKSQQNQGINTLLNAFCYKTEFFESNKFLPPYFFAKDLQTLKLYQEKGVKINSGTSPYGQDLLSYILINHVLYEKNDEEQKELLTKSAKRFNLKVEKYDDSPISGTNRESVLKYLSENYNRALAPKDIFSNTAVSYAILTLEPQVLQNIIKDSPTLSLLRKNKYGISPVHLAFATKYPQDKSVVQKNNAEINDMIVKNIELKHIGSLTINNVQFFDFVELMKENNIDLYEKLKKKFKFNSNVSKLQPQFITKGFNSLNDAMKYPDQLKEFSK